MERSKVKDSWENQNNMKFEKDYPYAYPWPPKYYSCNFCQREFKSAQALGGHMNIHRKDRARLHNINDFNNNNINININDNDNIDQNPNLNSNPNNPNPSPSSNPNNPNPNRTSSNPNNPNPNPTSSNPNLNPSSNPNISPTSSLRFSNPSSITNNNGNIYAHQYSLVSLSLSNIPPPLKNGPTRIGSRDGFRGDCEQSVEKWMYNMSSPFEHYNNIGSSNNNNNNIVRLDLELCLGDSKEDLDLELRLGI